MAVIQPWTTNKNINGFGLNTNTPKATPPPRTGPVAAPGQSTLNFAPEPQGPPPVNNQPVLEVPTPSMSVNTQKPEAANAIANAAAQVPRVVQGIGQGVIDIATGVGSGFVDMARTNPKDVTSLPGGATPAPAQAAIQKGLETQSNAVVGPKCYLSSSTGGGRCTSGTYYTRSRSYKQRCSSGRRSYT